MKLIFITFLKRVHIALNDLKLLIWRLLTFWVNLDFLQNFKSMYTLFFIKKYFYFTNLKQFLKTFEHSCLIPTSDLQLFELPVKSKNFRCP